MQAKRLIEILGKHPEAEVHVWGDTEFYIKIICENDSEVIDIRKKTV